MFIRQCFTHVTKASKERLKLAVLLDQSFLILGLWTPNWSVESV